MHGTSPNYLAMGKSDFGQAHKPESVAILVPSWDGYQDVWHPFFHSFFKYWPDCPYLVYLGSNTAIHPDDRVIPILVGADKDYSSNLIAMLEEIQEDWIILWVDDALLSAPVDTERFINVIRMAQEKRAAYLQLIPGPSTQVILDENNQEFGKIPNNTPYRVSISLGLWRKDAFLNLLRLGETAWDFELLGNQRSFEMDEEFYCLVGDPVAPLKHGIRQGKWTVEAVKFFRQEGVEEYSENRPVQSVWWRIYPIIRWYAPRFLVKWWQNRKI